MVKITMSFNVMVAVIAMAATISVMLHTTEATKYTVGDALGWTIPPGGAATYASWASMHKFVVNDSLAFNFAVGENDLVRVSKEDYEACNTLNPFYIFQSPVSLKFLDSGKYYFTCTFAGHCSKGQKIVIDIGSSSPSPIASLSPPPSPPPPGAVEADNKPLPVNFVSQKMMKPTVAKKFRFFKP